MNIEVPCISQALRPHTFSCMLRQCQNRFLCDLPCYLLRAQLKNAGLYEPASCIFHSGYHARGCCEAWVPEPWQDFTDTQRHGTQLRLSNSSSSRPVTLLLRHPPECLYNTADSNFICAQGSSTPAKLPVKMRTWTVTTCCPEWIHRLGMRRSHSHKRPSPAHGVKDTNFLLRRILSHTHPACQPHEHRSRATVIHLCADEATCRFVTCGRLTSFSDSGFLFDADESLRRRGGWSRHERIVAPVMAQPPKSVFFPEEFDFEVSGFSNFVFFLRRPFLQGHHMSALYASWLVRLKCWLFFIPVCTKTRLLHECHL